MTCIKTGAQVYFKDPHRYIICDIHQFSNGMWVLRANSTWRTNPIRGYLHATVEKSVQDWPGEPHTFVVEYIDYTYHGYDGVPISGFGEES